MERKFSLKFGVLKDVPIVAFLPFTLKNRVKVILWNLFTPFNVTWLEEWGKQ